MMSSGFISNLRLLMIDSLLFPNQTFIGISVLQDVDQIEMGTKEMGWKLSI